MDYLRSLTLPEESLLSSKAAKDQTTVKEMLDTKINQYLEDVKRDMGLDERAEVTKALADPAKFAIAKAALGL